MSEKLIGKVIVNDQFVDEITSGSGEEIYDGLEELKLNMSDEEIIKLANEWKSTSSTFRDEIKDIAERNYAYYTGDFSTYSAEEEERRIIDNRIFISVETIVPMVSSKPAQPVVYPGKNTTESKKLASMHQKILLNLYRSLSMQQIIETLVRHVFIYRVGVLKYGIKNGRVFTDYVLPTKLYFDPEATCIETSSFIGEIIKVRASELVKVFPKKKKEISEKVGGKLGTKVEVVEWWADDMMFVVFKDIVLKKMKNPHFEYEGIKEVEDDAFGDYLREDFRYNYFTSPKKPYIFLQAWNSGLKIIDDTNPLEQSIPLQDDIDAIKKQIQDNIDIVANPILLGQGFNETQIDDINARRVGDAIGITDSQSLAYLQPRALPAYLQNTVMANIAEIDSLFGTHGTTRGERGRRETATGRQILRQGDEDRQAILGRGIERAVNQLYKAWTHLIKVYYEEEQLLPDLSQEGSEEFLEMSRNNIEDGIEIEVLAGSTLPEDKLSKRSEALELFQLQAMTLDKLYERLGFENPLEDAEYFYNEQTRIKIANASLEQKIKMLQETGEEVTNEKLNRMIEAGIEGIGEPATEQTPPMPAEGQLPPMPAEGQLPPM